jgi:hypothetical protein
MPIAHDPTVRATDATEEPTHCRRNDKKGTNSDSADDE